LSTAFDAVIGNGAKRQSVQANNTFLEIAIMRGMKKIALATAIAAISTATSADVELMEDDDLGTVSGQAGITIDIDTRFEIGEFVYRDAGNVIIQGISVGGNSLGNGTGSSGSYLDNLRAYVDIAGDGSGPGDNNILNYGFSGMRDIGEYYVLAGNLDPVYQDIATGLDSTRNGLAIDGKKLYNDGDLVIHLDFTDGWDREGGFEQYAAAGRFVTDTYDVAEEVLEHAVDIRIEVDAIGLGQASYVLGTQGLDVDGNHATGLHEGDVGTTTLISQLGVQGYLGPDDIVIQNRGNGFDGSGPLGAGTGNGDSKILTSRYFLLTDIDMYVNIAGVQIKDMKIHNRRGDLTGIDGTSSFNFAHSKAERYAVKDAVLSPNLEDLDPSVLVSNYKDGIADHQHFKGDIDIPHLSFGDENQTIGEIYLTDLDWDARRVISAH
jgi:hypothetical protein